MFAMQTKRDFIKTSAVLGATVAIPKLGYTAPSVERFLTNVLPHYHEFNTAENPRGYGWCGHTALKISMQYKTGVTKTLSQIHNTFHANSAGYRANRIYGGYQWCAALQDLMWAARLSQNGGYGRSSIDANITTYGTNSDFFTKVKNAINSNCPVIIPSDWKYANVGHFWVIVGYIDTGDVATSSIHLRDVAIPSVRGQLADWTLKVQDFLYSTPLKQMLIIK